MFPTKNREGSKADARRSFQEHLAAGLGMPGRVCVIQGVPGVSNIHIPNSHHCWGMGSLGEAKTAKKSGICSWRGWDNSGITNPGITCPNPPPHQQILHLQLPSIFPSLPPPESRFPVAVLGFGGVLGGFSGVFGFFGGFWAGRCLQGGREVQTPANPVRKAVDIAGLPVGPAK